MKKQIAKYASKLLSSAADSFVASLKVGIGSPKPPKELLNK